MFDNTTDIINADELYTITQTLYDESSKLFRSILTALTNAYGENIPIPPDLKKAVYGSVFETCSLAFVGVQSSGKSAGNGFIVSVITQFSLL